MNDFGERLKVLRKAAGLTQQGLADKINVHLQTVSKWERGLSEPDFSMLGEIAEALAVPLEELLGEAPADMAYCGAFSAASFGGALSSERKKKGQTQDEVAAAAGVSVDTISKWERGVTCPDMRQLCALSRHFGTPPSKLYYGVDERKMQPAPIKARRRVPRIAVIAAMAAVLVAAILAIMLPALLVTEFTVTVEGMTYTVSSGDWFVPAAAEKEGYELVGYVDEDGNEVTFPVKIKSDATYTAVYVAREYNIDYWLNGGSFEGDVAYTFTVESGEVELATPVKSGSDFAGWYLTADYSGDPVTSITCAAADVNLYARWSNVVYTIRYELNGGSLSQDNPATVTADEEIALNAPLRGGYIFLGWYDSDGNRYESVGGANASNLTLYALWQQSGENFTVTYDLQGGTLLGENPVSVGAGEAHTLYGAEKAGYDFVGWNTAEDGSGDYYTELYGISDDLVLYAVYTPKVYTIIYELNGGTYCDGVNPNGITYGEEVELAPLTKAGYTFVGWFDEEGNQITVINESNILRLTTLYARFTGVLYTIYLDGGGGSFEIDGQTCEEYTLTVEYGTEYVLPECTLAGYDFLGWLDSDGNLTSSVNVYNIGDGITFTAYYRQAGLTYAITYVLNGGTLSRSNPEQVAYNQVVALNEPAREGYLFLGWNTKADGSGEYVTCTSPSWESDITLYAIWQEIRVNGSTEYFSYEVGAETAVITGYTGSFGEDVSLVIPSYIGGKPVVAITGALNPDYNNSTGKCAYLYSIELPDTLVSLGEYALSYLAISQPVTIPASVSEIGAYCFKSSELSLYFREGSALKSIGEYAFASAWINNNVVLPEGVEVLENYAFYDAKLRYGGIVLPDTLKYIGSYALSIGAGNDSSYCVTIYIPSSVEYIEAYAFGTSSGKKYVYTALSQSVTAGFAKNWDSGTQVTYLESEVTGITLLIDGEEAFVCGQHFALPELEKEGYTFLGWREAGGDFVYCNYIPLCDGIVLEAVFEEVTESDGRSQSSPAVLQAGETYEFIISGGEEFYFIPDVSLGERIIITYSYEVVNYSRDMFPGIYMDGDDSNACTSGVSFTYTGGIFFAGTSYADGIIYRLTITVTVR